MANFFNLLNVRNPFLGSRNGNSIVCFEQVCPNCGYTESRSLEPAYVRGGNGFNEEVKCEGSCSEGRNYWFKTNICGDDI